MWTAWLNGSPRFIGPRVSEVVWERFLGVHCPNLSPMSGFLLAEDGTWETRWQVAAFSWSLGLTAAAGVPPRLCPAAAPCFRNRHARKRRASAALKPVVVTETLVVKESRHRDLSLRCLSPQRQAQSQKGPRRLPRGSGRVKQ